MEKRNIEFIEKVIRYLMPYNFSPDVRAFIACQFALESSFGRSSLALSHRNYCGMKTPLVRISVALNAGQSSSSDKWAEYLTLSDCVLDYVLCIQYYRPFFQVRENLDFFKSFIRGKYCPDKDYLDKINFIYQQFKNQTK